MEEKIITSLSDLDLATNFITKSSLCRGVSDKDYELIPSLFRKTSDAPAFDDNERANMWLFKTSAKAHLKRIPDSEIEWLVLAQHHGLPTRLLDWSLSPLVACYFAVKSKQETDGAIYIYDKVLFKQEENIEIKALESITAFFPSHMSPRVTAQSGMFTIHPTNEIKLNHKNLLKLIIPANKKTYLLDRLSKFGIHDATMFPDLDGLSAYIKYIRGY